MNKQARDARPLLVCVEIVCPYCNRILTLFPAEIYTCVCGQKFGVGNYTQITLVEIPSQPSDQAASD